MNPSDEIMQRLKRKNAILFYQNSEFLSDFFSLLNTQTDKTLILWALDLAYESACCLKEKYPRESRFTDAVFAAKGWAGGKIKMREAQRKILDCHAFAKKITDKADIASCHAVGQACGVVHTRRHAPGYPIYDLTSAVYRYGAEKCLPYLERRKQEYINRLFYWAERSESTEYSWADFIVKRN